MSNCLRDHKKYLSSFCTRAKAIHAFHSISFIHTKLDNLMFYQPYDLKSILFFYILFGAAWMAIQFIFHFITIKEILLHYFVLPKIYGKCFKLERISKAPSMNYSKNVELFYNESRCCSKWLFAIIERVPFFLFH
jgi:hypothetical protein